MRYVWMSLLTLLLAGAVIAQPEARGDRKHPLADAPQVTVAGAVKAVVVPDGDQGGPIRLRLATAAEPVVVLLGPAPAIKALGLPLTEGDQVSVSGWKLTENNRTAIVCRELTTGGKTFTLRDAQGIPAWEAQAQPATKTGTVQQIETPDAGAQGPKVVRFSLAAGQETVLVALVPAAELQALGLSLKIGDQVTVHGMLRQGPKQAILLAITLETGGKTYQIRKVNPFEHLPQRTLTGPITGLVQEQGPVRFTLKDGNTTRSVILGPAKYLEKLGLTLTNGAQVTVTGWAADQLPEAKHAQRVDGPVLIAREITVDEKTYTFRDADGTPAWPKQDPARQPRTKPAK